MSPDFHIVLLAFLVLWSPYLHLPEGHLTSCIEEKVALVGQEISIVPTAQTNELCQQECQRNSSCSFYTFSQDKNLTCQLYSITSGKSNNSTSISGSRFCNTRCFEDHVEYYGPDVKAQIFATSALECQLKCQGDSDCSFFTYFPTLLLCIHKRYVLKVYKNTLRSLFVISGPKFCGEACFQNQTMFGEPTIAYLNVTNSRSCQIECQRHPRCTSFSFSRGIYNVTCLLKRGRGSRNSLPSILMSGDPPAVLMSGPKFCSRECLEPSIAYLGSNIFAFNDVKSVQECGRLCQETESCYFFTYSETLLMCTLKSGWDQRITLSNSISGKIFC